MAVDALMVNMNNAEGLRWGGYLSVTDGGEVISLGQRRSVLS